MAGLPCLRNRKSGHIRIQDCYMVACQIDTFSPGKFVDDRMEGRGVQTLKTLL